jgi:FixJ family two-component response regulator
LQVGAVGFLQKPFDSQALVNLINVALEGGGDMDKGVTLGSKL